MSHLHQAMALLMATFKNYAGKEGDASTLTKAELSDLLRNELAMDAATDKAAVDKVFSMLDSDKDGVVDFKEYVTFVATLTMIIGLK